MRPLFCASLIAIFGASPACEPPPGTPTAPTPRAPVAASCISIAAWNDLHGQLGPDEAQVDNTRIPAGGLVALADQLALVRDSGDPVVALDAGDLFTGPLDSTLAEGAPVIDAYNVMGVDAAAIGNHEFDFGPVGYERVVAPVGVGDEAGADGPRGALFARMSSARFPFLSANLQRTDGTRLGWAHALPSTHIKRGGFDIGVVGYSTVETPITTLKPNVVGLDFATNAASRVAAEVRSLRAAGASPVVLLAHASIEGTLPQVLEDPLDPEGARRVGELAALLDAMPATDRPDVIVAGHRHQWMLGKVRGVPIVSSDCHGVGLARIRYCRAYAGAAPRLDRIERRASLPGSAPSTPLGGAVAAAVAPWRAKVKAQAETVVTTLKAPCAEKALNGTALGEQTARAIAEHAGAAADPPAGVPLVALVNTGGLRAPLRAGPVRYRDVFATSPFESGIAICATTRGGLARTLSNSIDVPESRDRLPFGIAGAKVTLVRAADGSLTLKRLVLDGSAPGAVSRDDEPVWLAIPDFILWGGDALLRGVTCTSTANAQLRVRDAWREVLARERACDGAPKNVSVEAP